MPYINEKLEEFKKYIKEKKVAIIGLGVSNIPLIEYLYNLGAKITVFDNKPIDTLDKKILDKIYEYKIDSSFGEKYLSKLHNFDIVFRSPSCRPDLPQIEKAISEGAILTSEIEMLLELCPAKTVGITGSDGKTTTITLIYEILKNKYNCYLGGNIGIPLFTKIDDIKPEDFVILELSSFQLMNMKVSPNIAVITNITPNHLDIHKSYEEYIESKTNIFKYQSEKDTLILNFDNEITKNLSKKANGKTIFFNRKTKLDDGVILDDKIVKYCESGLRRHILNIKDINLRGIHNAENICAAVAATIDLIDIPCIVKTITEFKGVEHRLELVKTHNGIKWYNDSIGSSPTRTIAGLNSFDENIVLIAGGYDKHLDYTPLAKPILDKVRILILMGQTSDKIYNAVRNEIGDKESNLKMYKVNDLKEAVDMANKVSTKGDIVLFSPASASFDMFKNFMERGNKFKEFVNNLKKI